MIILAGCIRIGTGKRDDAMMAMEPIVEATRAEAGCVAYSFAFDILDDHLLRIFEVFEDAAALAAHRASAHMAEWRAVSALLGISDRNMWQYEAGAPRAI